VTRDDLLTVLERAATGWRDGDAASVGDAFALDVEYLDPFLYRFERREDLLPTAAEGAPGRVGASFRRRVVRVASTTGRAGRGERAGVKPSAQLPKI
jgi:hypothetical protein